MCTNEKKRGGGAFIYEYGDDQRPLNYLHCLDSFWVMPHCGCKLTAASRPLGYSKTIC
jgi:hypothetical protein